MRIISGKFKGQKIQFIKSNITRPLKDSVKENIFNIITHSNAINLDIQGAKVIDLYSGAGSFGIECISRLSEKVVFFDRDQVAVNKLKENLKNLSLGNQTLIVKDDVENILKWVRQEKFDLFFCDPPFSDQKFMNVLEKIKKSKIFKKKHLIIIHRERRTEDNLTKCVNIKISRIYGRSKIIFGTFN